MNRECSSIDSKSPFAYYNFTTERNFYDPLFVVHIESVAKFALRVSCNHKVTPGRILEVTAPLRLCITTHFRNTEKKNTQKTNKKQNKKTSVRRFFKLYNSLIKVCPRNAWKRIWFKREKNLHFKVNLKLQRATDSLLLAELGKQFYLNAYFRERFLSVNQNLHSWIIGFYI